MTEAAFWIAISGLVLSVVSITWQVVSWTYTGARIRVDVARGFATYDAGLRPVVIVTARNIGRSPSEVRGWGLRLPDGASIVWPNPESWAVPERMPATVDGLHQVAFYFPDDVLFPDLVRRTGATSVQVRGFVNLGTGKAALSSPLRIEALT